MKNSIKTFICAFALITSAAFTANADDKENKKASRFGTGIYINKQGKINVFVDKQNTDANTTLLVRNEQGKIVYREVIEKDNQKFGRLLNVEDLEAGKYEINIISDNEIQKKGFQLSEPTTERVITIK
jgi:hypothetical protein